MKNPPREPVDHLADLIIHLSVQQTLFNTHYSLLKGEKPLVTADVGPETNPPIMAELPAETTKEARVPTVGQASFWRKLGRIVASMIWRCR